MTTLAGSLAGAVLAWAAFALVWGQPCPLDWPANVQIGAAVMAAWMAAAGALCARYLREQPK